ncbi:MAG: N-acetylneuraminate synthase [Saprospiraceae bacterium]
MPKTCIIAEAGVNHNGDLELAKRLVEVAAEAGADFVKFQTFQAEKMVSASAKKADYQVQNTGNADEGQLAMLKKLELSRAQHEILLQHCQQHRIQFLSTAFDLDSIDLLSEFNLALYKIPSGEITNLPYLRKIASKNKPVLLSTGMADLGEIEDALDVLQAAGLSLEQITVLHCNTEYPTPFADVNLRAMRTIQQAFGVKVGYSDHTLGIEVPIAAVALGATVIEKHFTLDRTMEGPDHKASLEPKELQIMVRSIRNIETALAGDGRKKPSPSERKKKTIARKSIHLSTDVAKGQIIENQHLIALRPGDGISPMHWEEVIGRRAALPLHAGHQLSWHDLAG